MVLGVWLWDQDGETALHQAARYHSLEMAELLLGARASVDATNKVRAGCSCLGAGCWVLGAECVVVGQYGRTPLQCVYRHGSVDFSDQSHQQMVALLSRQ